MNGTAGQVFSYGDSEITLIFEEGTGRWFFRGDRIDVGEWQRRETTSYDEAEDAMEHYHANALIWESWGPA